MQFDLRTMILTSLLKNKGATDEHDANYNLQYSRRFWGLDSISLVSKDCDYFAEMAMAIQADISSCITRAVRMGLCNDIYFRRCGYSSVLPMPNRRDCRLFLRATVNA